MNTAWRIVFHVAGIGFVCYSAWGVQAGKIYGRYGGLHKRNEDPTSYWVTVGFYAFFGILLISLWWR